MTKTYGAASGDGTINNSGMTLEQARRRAQEIADQTGEPAEVYAEPANEGDDPVAIVQPSADEITDEPSRTGGILWSHYVTARCSER